ncbi:MAG: outer membrane beta-barrel protein [Elusimicrobiota bacterium]|jgi:opacity protein-like surface antigen|nr:outer membrane beta-barrel protein [Elusimicrobiota bacterium]
MKKLGTVVLAVMFLSASAAFARPEINVRVGLDASDTFSEDREAYGKTISSSFNTETGFTIGSEILFPVFKILKVGGGIEYLSARKLVKGNSETELFLLPIYAAIQANPIKAAQGVFFRGIIGVAVFGFVNEATTWMARPDSGFYLGAGSGYEFPFGLILGLDYKYFIASSKYTDNLGAKYEYSYDIAIIGVNIGYKFKL